MIHPRFSPEINLGHIFQAVAMVATGIAIYVGLAVSIRVQETRITVLESTLNPLIQSHQAVASDGRLREMRLTRIETDFATYINERREFESSMLEELSEMKGRLISIDERFKSAVPNGSGSGR